MPTYDTTPIIVNGPYHGRKAWWGKELEGPGGIVRLPVPGVNDWHREIVDLDDPRQPLRIAKYRLNLAYIYEGDE